MVFLYVALFVIVVIAIVTIIVVASSKTKYNFPYWYINFDVSGTRTPNIDDYIDNFLIKPGLTPINQHIDVLNNWKKSCEEEISKYKKRKKQKRMELYSQCLDESHLFQFSLQRSQTRYRQINYEKHSYKVFVTVKEFSCSYDYLLDRYNQLEEINFETTLSTFNNKEQRSLMTKELRQQIALRDNYTCRICGKYMPDEIGLHIDHIIPIAKGGKSIPSNLQVLCSKCNGKKSNKNHYETSTETNKAPALVNRTSYSYDGYDEIYQKKLQGIQEKIILSYQNNNIDKVYSLTKMAESIEKKSNQNYISMHFFYQTLADIVYSLRSTYDNAISDCLLLCDKDIELLHSTDFGNGASILTITRKAIILEKEGKLADAIKLCDFAIRHNYLDNKKPFSIRKARLELKLKKHDD